LSTSPPSEVLAHLRKKIDLLEEVDRRFSRAVSVCKDVDDALPYRGLPLGCVHEMKGGSLASAIAFAGLLAARIPSKGAIVYVASDRSFHPLGLLPYGARMEQWIHISARRSEDRAWTVLEALRCPQVSAVLAVMKRADLTYCRKLQLATENSGATGFLLGDIYSEPVASAITRWQISSIVAPPGHGLDELFWALELLYCRGAQPRKWIAAWHQQRLEILRSLSETVSTFAPEINLREETAVAG
jgi:protein ImuA